MPSLVRHFLAFISIALATSGVRAADGLPEKIDRPKTEHGFCSVSYPQGMEEGSEFALLFWFHGTGGRPNSGIGKGHPNLVTVGMSYLKREHVPPGKYAQAHWRECVAVREALEQQGLKFGPNLVAGMSKGGWMAFYIAAVAPEGLDAVGIFAAGKDPNTREVPKIAEGRKFSVLVGTGETDPNFPQAQLAVKVLREAGAQVFYEEWPGEGHTYHRDGRVRDWLDVESRRSRPGELKAFCTAKVAAELIAAEAIKDKLERYLALRMMAGDPRVREVRPELRRKVADSGMALGKDPEVRKWTAEMKSLRKLVEAEREFFTRRDFLLGPLEKLVADFESLTSKIGPAELKARAAYGHLRCAKMLAIYRAQKKARQNPEFRKLTDEYAQLQKVYQEKRGEPGEEVMQRLKEVGARLGELRHQSSMAAFRDAEFGTGGLGLPAAVREAIENDPAVPEVFSGTAF